MSTSSLAQPSRSTTTRASSTEPADDVRYGIRTHKRRSGPTASAARNATRAESMPPDSPSRARSKPAWRSWFRMKSTVTRRATSVSIASSGGSSKSWLDAGADRLDSPFASGVIVPWAFGPEPSASRLEP